MVFQEVAGANKTHRFLRSLSNPHKFRFSLSTSHDGRQRDVTNALFDVFRIVTFERSPSCDKTSFFHPSTVLCYFVTPVVDFLEF